VEAKYPKGLQQNQTGHRLTETQVKQPAAQKALTEIKPETDKSGAKSCTTLILILKNRQLLCG
jgi:hypothetical protein